MNQKLSVSAIKNGTVIDHVLAGQALRIIQLLSLHHNKSPITIGMYLPSKSMQCKDLIKIENRFLSTEEANDVMVFAPDATINIIENFKVITKLTTSLPSAMRGIFLCPNKRCVSRQEPITSHFLIETIGKNIKLRCHYCEHLYERDQVKVNIG